MAKITQNVHGSTALKGKRKRKYNYQCREISSYKIFNKYVKYDANSKCDASDILSPPCYAEWVGSRRKLPKKPQEAFRRALTAHCRGVDGRKPFSVEIETSLLIELRKKKAWSCFENCDECGSIGVQGFPSLGYHEKKNAINRYIIYHEQNNAIKEDETKTIVKPTINVEAGVHFQKFKKAKTMSTMSDISNIAMQIAPVYNQVDQGGLDFGLADSFDLSFQLDMFLNEESNVSESSDSFSESSIFYHEATSNYGLPNFGIESILW